MSLAVLAIPPMRHDDAEKDAAAFSLASPRPPNPPILNYEKNLHLSHRLGTYSE